MGGSCKRYRFLTGYWGYHPIFGWRLHIERSVTGTYAEDAFYDARRSRAGS